MATMLKNLKLQIKIFKNVYLTITMHISINHIFINLGTAYILPIIKFLFFARHCSGIQICIHIVITLKAGVILYFLRKTKGQKSYLGRRLVKTEYSLSCCYW